MISMTPHTDAGIPVKSEENPAIIPPIIPPTSKYIEKSPASLLDTSIPVILID